MKMNKIVASVSAAALAVSALATSAFAAGPYTVSVTDTVLDHYEIALEGSVETGVPSDTDDFLTTPVAMKVEQTVTSALYDLTINGSIEVEQSYQATIDTTPAVTSSGDRPSSETKTGKVSGSEAIKDMYLPGTSGKAKDVSVAVSAIDFMKYVDTTKVEFDFTKSKIKVTAKLDTSLWSVQNLKDVIGTTNFDTFFNANGLAKDADALERNVSRGLLVTGASSAIAVYPKEANGALATTDVIDNWTVTGLKVVTKQAPYVLKDGGNYYTCPVAFKGNFNFDALKDMTKGGTVTLKFSQAVDAGKQYSINIAFSNADLYLGSTNAYSVTGDTLTFDMPADFSGTLDGIYGLPLMTIWSSDWTMPDKCELVSVTLTPKSGADVAEATTTAPAANDGDTNSNKPADSNNNNAASSGDKNQPTGVAIAIVPAIVAAAGVVISKKRK
ncbi:MAG: hypothetical protein NC203_02185 [Firmicutes bacterium]|nr:hypothetical protein [[Eubacterium] siraeum]MCM1487153.1 hypothetical protein [Bacillota bacterium]